MKTVAVKAVQDRSEVVARLDRRKAESRQRLLAAARALFIERGYHATRPQDIARAADVGHGTFYLHFADKEACFVAFAEEARAELAAFVGKRLAGSDGVEAQLRALMAALLDYADEHPGVLKAAMTDVSVIASDRPLGKPLIERWAEEWASGICAGARVGAIYDDYDAEVAGHAIVGLIRGAAGCGRRRRDELVDTVVRFLVRALVPPGAAERAGRHNFLRDGME
ncbi:MAG TPA: helix-turn-helix domain-containing protein [Stellaceae bacterium]|nr:helix-turn-helix domain-containing protein [Stellaceae bacterium]